MEAITAKVPDICHCTFYCVEESTYCLCYVLMQQPNPCQHELLLATLAEPVCVELYQTGLRCRSFAAALGSAAQPTWLARLLV